MHRIAHNCAGSSVLGLSKGRESLDFLQKAPSPWISWAAPSRTKGRAGCSAVFTCTSGLAVHGGWLPALLPPAVALSHRQDPHERFHGVDLAVVDLEHFPHRQLIAAALAHAPGHAQPDDAHPLVRGDDTGLH